MEEAGRERSAGPRPPLRLVGHAAIAVLGLACAGPAAAQIRLPMTMEHEWPVVPVLLGETGDTLELIVDTGAARSAITASTARRLGLERLRRITVQGASGAQTVDVVRVPALRVGDAEMRDLRVIVVDDETLTPDDMEAPPYDGVLGNEILARFDVLFSEPTGELLLLEPGEGPGELEDRLAAPIGFGGSTRPRRFIGHAVEVNDVAVPAIFDTGARSMILNGTAAERAGVVPVPGSAERRRRGVGTLEIIFEDATIGLLEVGTRRVEAVPARISDLPVFRILGMGDGSAMLLGAGTLLGCPVFISYVEESVRYCR